MNAQMRQELRRFCEQWIGRLKTPEDDAPLDGTLAAMQAVSALYLAELRAPRDAEIAGMFS